MKNVEQFIRNILINNIPKIKVKDSNIEILKQRYEEFVANNNSLVAK